MFGRFGLLYDKVSNKSRVNRKSVAKPDFVRQHYAPLDCQFIGSDIGMMSRVADPTIMYSGFVQTPICQRAVIIPFFTDQRTRLQCVSAYISAAVSADPELVNMRAKSPIDYAGVFCTIIINLFDCQSLRRDLLMAGGSNALNITVINLEDVEALVEYDNHYANVAHAFVDQEDAETQYDSYSLAKISVFLLFLTKAVNPENCERYLDARFTAFCGTLGRSGECAKLNWDQQAARACNMAIASCFELRKLVFRLVYSAAFRPHVTHQQLFKAVLSFYRFADCGHIALISDHLLSNPALMSLVRIQDCDRTLSEAIEFLIEKGEHAAYVRLLYKPDDCQKILARHLQDYKDVALCIARHKSPQYDNYIPQRDRAKLAGLAARVKEYMDIVDGSSVASAIESNNTLLHSVAKTFALSQALPLDDQTNTDDKIDQVGGRE